MFVVESEPLEEESSPDTLHATMFESSFETTETFAGEESCIHSQTIQSTALKCLCALLESRRFVFPIPILLRNQVYSAFYTVLNRYIELVLHPKVSKDEETAEKDKVVAPDKESEERCDSDHEVCYDLSVNQYLGCRLRSIMVSSYRCFWMHLRNDFKVMLLSEAERDFIALHRI